MPTPTLGYEDDTKISKIEIAQIQLTEAISLFMEEKFLCALTLSGAAEEVLARLLNAKGEQSVVEESVAKVEEIRSVTGLAVMGNKPPKEMFNQWNSARNTVKHHGKNEEEIVTLNLFDEGYWMIKRALGNASRLGAVIENHQDFENWCIEQIHL
jgi:hypothetical protein